MISSCKRNVALSSYAGNLKSAVSENFEYQGLKHVAANKDLHAGGEPGAGLGLQVAFVLVIGWRLRLFFILF
jgi:hypothetical protein